MTQFIQQYQIATNSDCERLIAFYEQMQGAGMAMPRQSFNQNPKHIKDDEGVHLEDFKTFSLAPTTQTYAELAKMIWDCWLKYARQFDVLLNSEFNLPHIWIQKTKRGQGYHVWHHEKDSVYLGARTATFILYLNDLGVDDGGETEFLYQSMRVKPKAGRLVIFPADYTHTHRGNPVLGDTAKYVVTGWIELNGYVGPK